MKDLNKKAILFLQLCIDNIEIVFFKKFKEKSCFKSIKKNPCFFSISNNSLTFFFVKICLKD